MAKILWLDDLRDPKDYGYEDAIWLKSFEDWLSFVSDEDNFNTISEIHFDNDLLLPDYSFFADRLKEYGEN